MSLLSLPNELLGRVVQETMPDGFESFVLSCKAVYQASRGFLEQHNTMKKRYRHFSYSGDGFLWDQDSCASSLQLIARIAEDPRIAKYIVTADFKEDSVPEIEDNVNALVQHLENSSEVRSLLDASSYLKEDDDDVPDVLRYFVKQCVPVDGNLDLATMFLLTLLSNATHLALPKQWEQWEYLAESSWDTPALLDVIVRRANDPNDPSAGLSKLTSILPSTAWGYDNLWKLSTFTPFLSIKSVRKFCAGSCKAIDDGYTGIAFDTPEYDSFGAGLEVVELVGAVVNGEELWKFLSLLPQLKTFRLSYETKWHGCGHDYDAGAAMKAIEDTVGDQLEELSFSVLNFYGDIETRVASMKRFTKLKILELDMQVVLGQPSPADQTDTSLDEISRLADLLPPTVESLFLLASNNDDYVDAFTRLFSDLASDAKERLPNLKRIVIRSFSEESNESNASGTDAGSGEDADEGWKADLKALGPSVQVEFVKVNDNALPRFMRQFCSRYKVETL